MAANSRRPLDSNCNYTIFNNRIDGKVPCWAIGGDCSWESLQQRPQYPELVIPQEGCIVGLCFQKVNDGLVRPVLPIDDFTPLVWTNAPSLIHNKEMDVYQLPDVSQNPQPAELQKWQYFKTLMTTIKNALMAQMTIPADPPPANLIEGFHSDVWIVQGAVEDRNFVSLDAHVEHVMHQFAQLGVEWPTQLPYEGFVIHLVEGLHSGSTIPLIKILLELFPEMRNELFTKALVKPPANCSANLCLQQGVPHCLVYGYDLRMLQMVQHERGRARLRLTHRIVLPKSLTGRSRSNSRSPSPDNNREITDDVVNTQLAMNPVNIVPHMCHHPRDYELDSKKFTDYFEPHKPDMLFYRNVRMGVVEVRLVIEVTSKDDAGQDASLWMLLKAGTEQVVKQCLAAISPEQRSIVGLLIVPDGMKIIKIVRELGPTHHHQPGFYRVKETELVQWDSDHFLNVLEELRTCILPD